DPLEQQRRADTPADEGVDAASHPIAGARPDDQFEDRVAADAAMPAVEDRLAAVELDRHLLAGGRGAGGAHVHDPRGRDIAVAPASSDEAGAEIGLLEVHEE